MRPVLFLDIDGVLNTDDMGPWEISRTNIHSLNKIVWATNCVMELSSEWRQLIHNGHMDCYGFQTMLRSHGLTSAAMIRGVTADGGLDDRGRLIADVMGPAPLGTPYCVIDDNDWGISEAGHPFVQTDPRVGLTAADAARAIEILTKSTLTHPPASL